MSMVHPQELWVYPLLMVNLLFHQFHGKATSSLSLLIDKPATRTTIAPLTRLVFPQTTIIHYKAYIVGNLQFLISIFYSLFFMRKLKFTIGTYPRRSPKALESTTCLIIKDLSKILRSVVDS